VVAAGAPRRASEAAGRTAGEVRTALAEGRQAMRQREAELRHQIDERQKQPPPL
jgi:DNA-directed RNA polymerase specialized sigma24 family protein